jgi:PAS domain S-box-containing protein
MQEPMTPLQASEIRYRRLFEGARDGILILDLDTLTIVDANPYLQELLGYEKDELLGKELWEIGLVKDREASRHLYRELQGHGYVRYDHLPLQAKGGQHREVEVRHPRLEDLGIQRIGAPGRVARYCHMDPFPSASNVLIGHDCMAFMTQRVAAIIHPACHRLRGRMHPAAGGHA